MSRKRRKCYDQCSSYCRPHRESNIHASSKKIQQVRHGGHGGHGDFHGGSHGGFESGRGFRDGFRDGFRRGFRESPFFERHSPFFFGGFYPYYPYDYPDYYESPYYSSPYY